jgi:intracellular sulfur oxidation DsrE/DsrF family protein
MDEELRVVIAADAPGDRAIRACRNLLRAAEEPVRAELVCFGPGLDLALVDGPHVGDLRALMSAGVSVQACANTLNARGLTAEALEDGVGVVPAAVLHLARRQQAGWAYLAS